MKGIEEASFLKKYLAHGCLDLGFKTIEVSIDYFPTVRNFIRLFVHVISLMSGMG